MTLSTHLKSLFLSDDKSFTGKWAAPSYRHAGWQPDTPLCVSASPLLFLEDSKEAQSQLLSASCQKVLKATF